MFLANARHHHTEGVSMSRGPEEAWDRLMVLNSPLIKAISFRRTLNSVNFCQHCSPSQCYRVTGI